MGANSSENSPNIYDHHHPHHHQEHHKTKTGHYPYAATTIVQLIIITHYYEGSTVRTVLDTHTAVRQAGQILPEKNFLATHEDEVVEKDTEVGRRGNPFLIPFHWILLVIFFFDDVSHNIP